MLLPASIDHLNFCLGDLRPFLLAQAYLSPCQEHSAYSLCTVKTSFQIPWLLQWTDYILWGSSLGTWRYFSLSIDATTYWWGQKFLLCSNHMPPEACPYHLTWLKVHQRLQELEDSSGSCLFHSDRSLRRAWRVWTKEWEIWNQHSNEHYTLSCHSLLVLWSSLTWKLVLNKAFTWYECLSLSRRYQDLQIQEWVYSIHHHCLEEIVSKLLVWTQSRSLSKSFWLVFSEWDHLCQTRKLVYLCSLSMLSICRQKWIPVYRSHLFSRSSISTSETEYLSTLSGDRCHWA